MKKHGTVILAGVMAAYVALVVVCFAAPTQAQPPLRWRYMQCMTNDCVSETLNKLSPERAAEAKLTTWQHWTYVWYRE